MGSLTSSSYASRAGSPIPSSRSPTIDHAPRRSRCWDGRRGGTGAGPRSRTAWPHLRRRGVSHNGSRTALKMAVLMAAPATTSRRARPGHKADAGATNVDRELQRVLVLGIGHTSQTDTADVDALAVPRK